MNIAIKMGYFRSRSARTIEIANMIKYLYSMQNGKISNSKADYL
jgi:hypothetical protein